MSAYVEVIGLLPGDTVTDAIDTYLDLKLKGLTADYTVVDVNGQGYPIGYFDEDNIELFKLGVTTLNNISFLVDKGSDELGEEYKTHTNYFIDQLFEKYEKTYKIESILREFSEIAATSKHTLLDEEQWNSVHQRIEELNKAQETHK